MTTTCSKAASVEHLWNLVGEAISQADLFLRSLHFTARTTVAVVLSKVIDPCSTSYDYLQLVLLTASIMHVPLGLSSPSPNVKLRQGKECDQKVGKKFKLHINLRRLCISLPE